MRFVRWSFSCPKARIGMARMKISVRMLTEAIAKYVLGRSLHPLGKVGTHALHGSFAPHSKAWISQLRARGNAGVSRMTYVDESDYDGLNCDEHTNGVYSVAEIRLREDPVVECQYASFDE